MSRRLPHLLLATLLAVLVTAPQAQAADVDFTGAVALSNCSGSIVRPAGTGLADPALVLSNGHCLKEGFPEPGAVIVDEPSDRSFTLLSADGEEEIGEVRATRLLYATMTGTDIALYRLDSSYARLMRSYGAAALPLASERPKQGAAIDVVSGFWKKTYSCSIDGFVHELREADYSWRDSIRYTPECDTVGGTSGSPIIDKASGEVVGVNNTGNESGEKCVIQNPCEVDENGNVTVREDVNYGQQTYRIPGCLDRTALDLARPGCELPKPATAAAGQVISRLAAPAR